MTKQYRDAGVNIEAGDEAVKRITAAVKSTRIPGVTGGFGGFGGLFDLEAAGVSPGSCLVSGADGVGTKLKLAFIMDKHDTVGIDCVAMCVNDILTLGARPLFFLDYLAVGRLEPGHVESIVGGVAAGCREAGCALLGGETAEMPGFYPDGEYDLAGFAVGSVDRERGIDGTRVRAGDVVIGMASSGFHSNGYSLVRKVFLEGNEDALGNHPEGWEKSLGEVLLTPTRIYVKPVLGLMGEGLLPTAMVHVTGGGLLGNIPRILPEELGVTLDQNVLDEMNRPEFKLLQKTARVTNREMYEVFNMGIGFILIVRPGDCDPVLGQLGNAARLLGHVEPRTQIYQSQAVDIPACR